MSSDNRLHTIHVYIIMYMAASAIGAISPSTIMDKVFDLMPIKAYCACQSKMLVWRWAWVEEREDVEICLPWAMNSI